MRVSDAPVAPLYATAMGVEARKKMDRIDWETFASPACQFGGSDYLDRAPASGQRASYNLRALHCTTPITPNRCHYWWALALDYGHQVPNLEGVFNSALEHVFKQDKDILEAIQMTTDQDVRGANAPEFLRVTDQMLVEARRILKKMLDAESSE